MKKVAIQDQIAVNKLKSVVLMLLVGVSIVVIGFVVGELYDPALVYFFTFIAVIVSLSFIVYSYFNSDKIVLKVTKARPANKKEHAHLINTVEGLAIAANIPTPKVYVIDSVALNAFATGRNPEHGVICVTTGLMKKMKRDELEGVIAHEMSHIQNYDVRFATLVSVLVGIVVMLSSIFRRSLWYSSGSKRERKSGSSFLIIIGIAFALLAPIFVKMIQLAISRKREFLADANGVYLTRYPEGLASALEKIGKSSEKIEVSEAVAPLFISNPLKKKVISNLFSTHPPIEERIKVLRSM
jgi:heat shock protein HtpX